MNGLIMFPLTVLMVFMAISSVGGSNLNITTTQDLNQSGTVITNDTTNLVQIPVGSFAFSITPTQGAIIIMSTVIAIGAIVGIRAFSTGLDRFSIETITKGAYYLAIWGILSAFAQPTIANIPYFGVILYLVLTLMYVSGFVQSIGGR